MHHCHGFALVVFAVVVVAIVVVVVVVAVVDAVANADPFSQV